MPETSGGLEAQYTVLKMKYKLTAKAPVRVVTFTDPEVPDEAVCGTRCSVDRSITIRPHSHEYYELILCLEDGGIHETRSGSFPVTKGTIIASAPGEVHGFRPVGARGRGRTVVCDYLAEWLYPDLRRLLDEMDFVSLFLHRAVFADARRIEVPQWHASDAILEACLRELRDIGLESERDEPSHSFMRSCLRKAMILLFRAYKATADPVQLLPVEPAVRSALLRIEDCILQGAPLRVSALAEEFNLGADAFSKSFKEATGLAPMDYYQHRRLRKACSSLLSTSRTVTEIAAALGYCDSAHFSHLFKRNIGSTPTAYRQNFGAPGTP